MPNEGGTRFQLTSKAKKKKKRNGKKRRFNSNDFERTRHLIEVIGRPSRLHKEDPDGPKRKRTKKAKKEEEGEEEEESEIRR